MPRRRTYLTYSASAKSQAVVAAGFFECWTVRTRRKCPATWKSLTATCSLFLIVEELDNKAQRNYSGDCQRGNEKHVSGMLQRAEPGKSRQ
jgi:hypothetical protein